MPGAEIQAIRFRPPVVIARIGDSPTPLEAFGWTEDPRIFGAGKTVITPRVSFEVLADGSLEAYLPGAIRFRDAEMIRPVCPFLELEAKVRDEWLSVDLAMLEDCGIELADFTFSIVAANRKAERRTNDPACRFEARALARGNDHQRHSLFAWTHGPVKNPLVTPDRPIWLGAFQVIRPVTRRSPVGADLGRIRVRFTPGKGQVYGPTIATRSRSQGSRKPHEIVPPENRFLNPASAWIGYDYTNPPYPPPLPLQTYDGESDLDRAEASWGVVDDTCDATVSATLATPSGVFNASARVFVGPPDYAPDRRPFYSLADDLADRDPASLSKLPSQATPVEWHDAVADLFRRVAETASLVDLERQRFRHIEWNHSLLTDHPVELPRGFPAVDRRSMTRNDRIGSKGIRLLSEQAAYAMFGSSDTENPTGLPRSEYARLRHDELAETEILIRFLIEQRPRLLHIMRPPFARTSELSSRPEAPRVFDFRDPRQLQSYLYDMRMPPYMRDCDFAPLSLTRAQWDLLMRIGPVLPKVDGEAEEFARKVLEYVSSNRRAAALRPRQDRTNRGQ